MHTSVTGGAAAVAFLVLSLTGLGAAQQPYLNLDFETATRGQLWVWTIVSPSGYNYAADPLVFWSGSQSLRMECAAANTGSSAFVDQYLPVTAVRGKHIRLAGYIKTSGMSRGYAGYWLRVDGASGLLSYNNMYGIGPSGTTDWQEYSFELDVSPDAVDVVVGAQQSGDGTAWFDNINITIDGVPYVDAAAPNTGEPTAEQLNWVAQTANPFYSPNPADEVGDLWPIGDMVGDAHIVGLGEGTHGTSEFFQMKHRLLEYLAEYKGFTIFAMEANMPEAELINRYVLTGQGDPVAVLPRLEGWPWDTQEVLDMIEWIRQYNAAGYGPIVFAGFDMQNWQTAIPAVQTFVSQAEPDYLGTVQDVYVQAARIYSGSAAAKSANTAQQVVDAAHAIWRHLSDNRSQYVDAGFSAYEVDWAIQDAAIVEQATQIGIYATRSQTEPVQYRDRMMAGNLEWILNQHPGARAVLWAHDGHVAKTPGWMGGYIAANHGADYVVFGQIFHAGSYNAQSADATAVSIRAWPATTSFPGTVEYVFHSTGMPWFILDLRKATPGDPGSGWLLGYVQYRALGAGVADGFFVSNRLAQDYDALIFFDRSTPSHLLPPYR